MYIAMENEERPKQDYFHSYNFYLLIILVGLMITSPLPAAFAESGESEGGGGGGDDDSGGGGDKDDEADEEDKQADRTLVADNIQGLDNTITQDSPSFDSTIAIGPGDRPNLDTDTALRSFMAPPVDPVDPLTPPVDPVDPLTPPVDPVDPLTPPVDPDNP
jgi:hypothetical protein